MGADPDGDLQNCRQLMRSFASSGYHSPRMSSGFQMVIPQMGCEAEETIIPTKDVIANVSGTVRSCDQTNEHETIVLRTLRTWSAVSPRECDAQYGVKRAPLKESQPQAAAVLSMWVRYHA